MVASDAKNLESVYCLQRGSYAGRKQRNKLLEVCCPLYAFTTSYLRLSLVSMVTKKMTHFDSFTTYHTHLDLAFMILLTTVYVKSNILPWWNPFMLVNPGPVAQIAYLKVPLDCHWFTSLNCKVLFFHYLDNRTWIVLITICLLCWLW